MSIFKKHELKVNQKLLAKYPCCDHLNIALRFLFKVDPPDERVDDAIEELRCAIYKSNGYYYKDVAEGLRELGYHVDEEDVHE